MFLNTAKKLKEVHLFDITGDLDKVLWKTKKESGTKNSYCPKILCGRMEDIHSSEEELTESGHISNQHETNVRITEEVSISVGIYIGKIMCGSTYCLDNCPEVFVNETWVDESNATHTTTPTMILKKDDHYQAFGYDAFIAFKQSVGEKAKLLTCNQVIQSNSRLQYILEGLNHNVEVQIKQSKLSNVAKRTHLIVAHDHEIEKGLLQTAVQKVFRREFLTESLISEEEAIPFWFNKMISGIPDYNANLYCVYNLESDSAVIVMNGKLCQGKRKVLNLDLLVELLFVSIFKNQLVDFYKQHYQIDWLTMLQKLKIGIRGLKWNQLTNVFVPLPYSFFQCFRDIEKAVNRYNKATITANEDIVSYKNCKLVISSTYFNKYFNSSAIQILNFIKENTDKQNIDCLFLIGGADLLEYQITHVFQQHGCGHKHCKIIVPLDQNACALKGAMLSKKDTYISI